MGANPATDVNRTRAKARDKSVTRLAILNAARKLSAERGSEAVTLAAVAAEAGFARPTVYGYFKSKEELLQALQAADLSAMADAMSGERPAPQENSALDAFFAGVVTPVEEEAVMQAPTAVEPVEEPIADEPVVDELIADEMTALPTPANETVAEAAIEPAIETEPVSALEVPAGSEKAELHKILRRLTPKDPENSEGSAAALARFDRRLRVVERAVGDLQGHQERAKKSTSTSVDNVAESLRGLNQRLEEQERRQRETFAELRANAREAARRLDSLEGNEHPTPLEPVEVAPEAPVPAEIQPVEDVTTAGGSADQPAKVEEPEADAPKAARVTYLTSARNSARIAAEATIEPKKPRPWLYRVPRKYLMFVCAAMTVVVFIIGALVVQRASAIAARADTMSPEVAQRAAAHRLTMMPKRMAVVSPLDELSAMATSGNAKAQLIVGLNYLKGMDGGAKKPVEAAHWIGRAAQRGEPMAQYWAGYLYQHGIGVSADPDAAIRWYEAAADQGNTKAMYNLGVGYAEGWTGAKDAPEASRWFARAARLGFVDAQFNLAVLYERGQGVPANLADAYKWYAIAAKNGDAESRKRLDAIATQLDSDDLSAAQRSAITFQPTPSIVAANTLPALDLKRT